VKFLGALCLCLLGIGLLILFGLFITAVPYPPEAVQRWDVTTAGIIGVVFCLFAGIVSLACGLILGTRDR